MDHPFFMHVFRNKTEYMYAKRVVHYSNVYGNEPRMYLYFLYQLQKVSQCLRKILQIQIKNIFLCIFLFTLVPYLLDPGLVTKTSFRNHSSYMNKCLIIYNQAYI